MSCSGEIEFLRDVFPTACGVRTELFGKILRCLRRSRLLQTMSSPGLRGCDCRADQKKESHKSELQFQGELQLPRNVVRIALIEHAEGRISLQYSGAAIVDVVVQEEIGRVGDVERLGPELQL